MQVFILVYQAASTTCSKTSVEPFFLGMGDGMGAKSWAIGKSHLSEDGLEITTQVETSFLKAQNNTWNSQT